MSKKVYELVTQKIVEKLEEGVIPWKMPFKNYRAINWQTQKPYRGINTILLQPGEYATFSQIKKYNAKVKKGAKSHLAVFWKWLEVEDKDDDEMIKKVPFLRYYNVFEINTQVDGLDSKRPTVAYEHDPIEAAEQIVTGYKNPPNITFEPTGAWYRKSQDRVNVPNKKEFESIQEYYSTIFHELIHSTGHSNRLSRKGITENRFGSEGYSKEELVAEIGASFLCNIAGIDNETIDNSTSYIQSWLQALKNDHTMIVYASQQAQKASDYILGEVNEDKKIA
ncbi:zincin-like metallopeptidase domain-containing protein [Lentibacillus sp. N15]|uniref:ArdC family protein n=1 Tax=Lentibacillus songyuanensis TaxID=3136161 RepID=UPI0031BA32BC